MRAYLVRIAKNHDLVGIFVASSLRELCYLIDECTDADICECAVLPSGGLYWDSPAARIPAKINGETGDDPIPWADNSETESWFGFLHANDAKWISLKLVAQGIPVLATLKKNGM